MLKRVGVDFGLPFRNFTGFRSHWTRNNGYGSWQARRDMLHDLFDPLHEQGSDRSGRLGIGEGLPTIGAIGLKLVVQQLG